MYFYYNRYSYNAWSKIWIPYLYKRIIDDFYDIYPNDKAGGSGYCKEGLKARSITNKNYVSIKSFTTLRHVGLYAPSTAKLHLLENRRYRKYAKYWYRPIFKRMPIKLGSLRVIKFKGAKRKYKYSL